MKKIQLLTLLGVICLCSCSTYNLSKSVWSNMSLLEKDGKNVDLTTSLYFVSDNQIEIYSSVVSDTTFVVRPFKYAEGNYNVTGNPKKEAKIQINTTTIDKQTLNYVGAYRKDDGMVLLSQDSIVKVFFKLPNVTLE